MAKHRDLAEQVSTTVRRWIRTGTLVPGEFYSVQYVAEQLGVSRSPAREGLLSLAGAGLIAFRRNRGFQVVVPDGRQVAEIFAVRLALEPTAAYLAARNATPHEIDALDACFTELCEAVDPDQFTELDHELHAAIMTAAGNPQARKVIDSLRALTRTLGPSTAEHSRALADIADEHRPVVDAVRTGDATRARLTMRQHLVTTGRLLMAQCAAAGDPDAWTAWQRLVDEDA